MYVFVVFYEILPIAASSTSLNYQKKKLARTAGLFLQDQALFSGRHINASLSYYFCPIFGLWGISLGPDLSIVVRFYFCSTEKCNFKDNNIQW